MAAVGLPYAFIISNQKPVGKFRLIGTADVQFLAVVALVSGEEQEGSFTRMTGAWSEW